MTASLDRRRFMGLATAALLAGGCSQRKPPAAVKGGQLRVATAASSTADTVDPAKQSVVVDYCRCNMFYDGLTQLDEHQRPQPALAETFETKDATVWTLKLRPGVRFHDGKPLTPADVVYSFRRHHDPAVGSKAKVFAEQIAEVAAFGSDAVRITLTGPNADLPAILGIPQFKIVRAGTSDFTTANGTGPFRCTDFTPGVRSLATRNDDYWGGPVRLGEVEMFSIADDSARLNALLSGDVDIVNETNPRLAHRIRELGFGVLESRSGGYTDLVMRLDQGPGRDPDFVLGMKSLMDRESMRNAIFRGFASIGNDQPLPPTNPYYAQDLKPRPFDPERSAFHFRKAGLAGTTIPVVTSIAAMKSDDMAVLMQHAGRAAGIDLDIRRVPADGYWTQSWMKVPVGFGNVNPRPTADIMFTQFFSSKAPWNESGWRNPRFDSLLLEARGDTDEARRRAIYGEMQHMIHDSAGIGIPLFISVLDSFSPRVKGLRPMPQGGLMGYDFARYVWLEGV